jgi:hypothetical protein
LQTVELKIKTMKKIYCIEDLDIAERIILPVDPQEIKWKGVDWVHLA